MHASRGATPPRTTGRSTPVGLLLILAGIAVNTSFLGRLAEDGEITGLPTAFLLAALQIPLIGIGTWLVVRCRPADSRKSTTLILVSVGVLIGGFLNFSKPLAVQRQVTRQTELLTAIGRSEDLIQQLTTRIPRLTDGALNLALPDVRSAPLFADEVLVTDLVGEPEHEPAGRALDGLAELSHWPVALQPQVLKGDDLVIWRPLFAAVSYFEHAKFKIVRGHFEGDDTYETDVAFGALAQLRAGGVAQVSGKLHVTWVTDAEPDDDEPTWLIHEWHTAKLALTTAARTLFVEELDRAVPDPDARERARRSLHEQLVLQTILDEEHPRPEWFTRESQDRHPGVSVVDIDRDGLDDVYVMARQGRNLLFHNQGDGTYRDIAPELGLDIDGHTACAVFADFDNDGDTDAMLGRTLLPSLYLVNEGGSFVDRSSELVDGPLPALVSAVSAADYDNDGLLDVYFSTYSARLHMPLVERVRSQGAESMQLPFLTDAEADGFYGRCLADDMHNFRNCPGPPNLLLRNSGERFAPAPCNADVQAWRHTFQSVFADYDGDGDADIYLANDFAPNNLLRNDGGRFTDITAESDTADIGFGMGAAWGDYDNDGAQDLYVTNMFSKAGRRITAQIAELDPRLTQLARGNSLLRNAGERFEKVSGMEPPALLVEKVGWSWGAQFFDFNNDGHLDIYAPSGFYTAPSQVEIPIDL